MPAKTSAKQGIALAALLVVLAAVIVYQLRSFNTGGVAGRPAQARAGTSRAAAARDRAAAVPELRLGALQALANAPTPAIGRNPFREKPVAPPPVAGDGPVGPPFVGPQPPPPPPPPPPIMLKRVGIVRGSGAPIAAGTDGRATSSRDATGS